MLTELFEYLVCRHLTHDAAPRDLRLTQIVRRHPKLLDCVPKIFKECFIVAILLHKMRKQKVILRERLYRLLPLFTTFRSTRVEREVPHFFLKTEVAGKVE